MGNLSGEKPSILKCSLLKGAWSKQITGKPELGYDTEHEFRTHTVFGKRLISHCKCTEITYKQGSVVQSVHFGNKGIVVVFVNCIKVKALTDSSFMFKSLDKKWS